MSLLARFEEVAELLFTGVFKKNSPRLQPVEIAKELVKVMFKNKQVSISQVYVPNIYRVYLHSSDWSPLASFGDAFLIELSKYLYTEGDRNGFTFLTKPAIELHADDTVQPREMFIEVDFDDSIEVVWPEKDERHAIREEEDWRTKTNVFQRVGSWNVLNGWNPGRNFKCFLEIIEGPDRGTSYPLDGEVLYIGRHAQCELVINDPEVSRRHVKVTETSQGWLLDDLGSTNGTWVNGQRITRHVISAGDRVQIGQTVFVIRTDGP